MDIVAADILSGLPVTEDSLRYILVLTDYFTKSTLRLRYLMPKHPRACASCTMISSPSVDYPTSYTQIKAGVSTVL